MKRILSEFILFALAFPGLLVIYKMIFGKSSSLTYKNIGLIVVLSFVNILLRNGLMVLKDKYDISSRNFEFMRRMAMIGLIGVYFYFK